MTIERIEPTRSERKRADIFAAAADEFRERGFHTTSMDAIAARANVSKRTLYHHYPSKDALYDAVIGSFWTQLVPTDEAKLLAELPVEDRLRTVARHRFDFLFDDNVLGLVRVVLAESLRSPELNRAYRGEHRHLGMLGFRGILRDESRRGRLQIDDIDIALSHFWGLVFDGLFFPVVLGLRGPARPAERARFIERGVTAFLTLYRPRVRKPR